jgi:hypothetical protein
VMRFFEEHVDEVADQDIGGGVIGGVVVEE